MGKSGAVAGVREPHFFLNPSYLPFVLVTVNWKATGNRDDRARSTLYNYNYTSPTPIQ